MSWLISRALMETYENPHCSLEQEGESLAENSLDGAPCALWSGTPTPQACSWLGRTTEPLSLSLSGMTYRHLTDDLGEAVLMSCLEASRAKTSPPQVREPASMANDPGCGRTWRESFAKWDPDTSSWRTPQFSLLEGFIEFSKTWPRWGMMRNDAEWGVLGAHHAGAPHKRDRIWIVAVLADTEYNRTGRREQQPECGQSARPRPLRTTQGTERSRMRRAVRRSAMPVVAH